VSLNESIVEDAALEWFVELGYAVGHGPQLAPGEPAAKRDSFSEVVLVGRLREAIRRLNPTIPEEALRKVLRVETPARTLTNRAFNWMQRYGKPYLCDSDGQRHSFYPPGEPDLWEERFESEHGRRSATQEELHAFIGARLGFEAHDLFLYCGRQTQRHPKHHSLLCTCCRKKTCELEAALHAAGAPVTAADLSQHSTFTKPTALLEILESLAVFGRLRVDGERFAV
jgi:hypothetical protein